MCGTPRGALVLVLCTRTTSSGTSRTAPRYHLACRTCGQARPLVRRRECVPVRPVLLRTEIPFFRRLAGDGRVDAYPINGSAPAPGVRSPSARHRGNEHHPGGGCCHDEVEAGRRGTK